MTQPESVGRTCYDCALLRVHQTGYSDYTPTGEVVTCALGHFDRRKSDDYGPRSLLHYDDSSPSLEELPNLCGAFMAGEPETRSVDDDWWDQFRPDSKRWGDVLLANKARCLRCDETVESADRCGAWWAQCTCGNVQVSGGLDFEGRKVENPGLFVELSERSGDED